ncbi:hypothetical protein [Streptomyces filamentosus]|uniref:hypothetical protein n=1 Tax=Streptomyces filamentosus TaxID=67294 RepID=UPI0033C2BF42
MTSFRRRFSVRLGLVDDDDALYDGVPDHLLRPLQRWVYDYASGAEGEIGNIMCLRHRLTVPGETNAAWHLSQQKGMLLLDVVDALLAFPLEVGLETDSTTAFALTMLLDNAGSAYRVADDGCGLELRVSPGVREALHQTVTDAAAAPSAGSAADHLAAAWSAAYGLHPDPVGAYSESIKAVEAAAHSVIQPNHPKATLGTMLGELKGARHKFTFAISTAAGDPIAPAEALMRALWDGQTSRHGSQGGTVPETLEAARAGVHLAATLVQWFVSGAVTRTP